MSQQEEVELEPERVMGWLRKRLIRFAKTYDEYRGKYKIPIDEMMAIFNDCLRWIDAILTGVIEVQEQLEHLMELTLELLGEYCDEITDRSVMEIINEDSNLLREARAIELYLVDISTRAKADLA